MKVSKDAFGQELWDYYKGETDHPEILERDDGLIGIGGFSAEVYFSEYKKWSPENKKAVSLVTGKKILDIGCGAGRHALYLQKKGFDVTGIDNSPLAIKICKLRGLKKAKVLAAKDVDKLAPAKFDSIIMLGHNIGLFGSMRVGKSILRKLYKLTTDNARIVATGIDPHDTKDPVHLAYQKWNKKRGRMPGQLRMRIRHKTHIGAWFDYMFLSKKEIKSLVDGTGWRLAKFDLKKDSGFYIAVLEKSS